MTHLEIVPYVGERPASPEKVVYKINPEFKHEVLSLSKEAALVTGISKPEDLAIVNDVQGRIQALLSEIEAVRKAAVAPVLAQQRAINNSCAALADYLKNHKERLAGIQKAYADAEKNRREEAIREPHENKKRRIELQKIKLLRVQEEIQKVQISLRSAETLEEMQVANKRIAELEAQLDDLQLAIDMAEITPVVEPVYNEPLIRGAVISEKLNVALTKPDLLLKNADPELILRLASVDLKVQITKDYVDTVRRQQQDNPDYDEVAEFAKIGITVDRSIGVSNRAASKVEV